MIDKVDIKLDEHQLSLALRLTTLQRKFIINIVGGMGNREAYIAAGGRAKNKNSQDSAASTMFNSVKAKAFYESLMQSATNDTILTREQALETLSNHVSTSMTDVADFSLEKVGQDAEGNDILQTVWTIKDSKDIDKNVMASIKSITMTSNGPRIELYDHQAAIAQLSKMLGWDKASKTELSGEIGIREVVRRIID